MAWIRRSWTPEDADEWKKEDWIAIIISPLAYMALTIGMALTLLLLWVGYIVLFFGVILTILLFRVINPKLSTISIEYEKKQKEYLEELEKIERWEEVK